MARIDIKNASVSYFLRQRSPAKKLERGTVGGQILSGGRHLEIAALKDISLSIAHGDRIGLVGINGSGKSTLLKLCAGALSTQRGSITIDGRVSAQFSLGAGIRPALSGRLNTQLKCLYMGIPQRRIADRIEEVGDLSGLGGYFELPVSTYSAGMRSRLVMSMLRLVRADILVIDEWIGAADPTANSKVNQLRSELVSSASIVVIASHSRSVLEQWTTRLAWLDSGRVREVGATTDLLPAYLSSMGVDAQKT